MAVTQEIAGRNYLSGPSDGPVCAPKLMTPVEKVSRTMSDARDLSNRVRCVVDNLIGSRPEAEAQGDRLTGGDGILTSLADNAEDTLNEIQRAHDDLSRLSKVLGLGL